jgi:hypothetical protein
LSAPKFGLLHRAEVGVVSLRILDDAAVTTGNPVMAKHPESRRGAFVHGSGSALCIFASDGANWCAFIIAKAVYSAD